MLCSRDFKYFFHKKLLHMTILIYSHHRSSILHWYSFLSAQLTFFLNTEVWGYNGAGGRYKWFELELNNLSYRFLGFVLVGFLVETCWKLDFKSGNVIDGVLIENTQVRKGELDWTVTTETSSLIQGAAEL